MRKIKRMLRENLDCVAPDHFSDIVNQESQSRKPVTEVKRRTGRFVVGLCAGAAICGLLILCMTNKDLLFRIEPDGEVNNFSNLPTDDSSGEAVGGRSGDGYQPAEVTTTVSLHDGEVFPVYSFERNAEKGKALLELIISMSGVAFDRENADYSAYESRPGNNDSELILWGNLDEGMFYYQNMLYSQSQSENREQMEKAECIDTEKWKSTTEKRAMEIAEALAPYSGQTVLSSRSVLSEEAEEVLPAQDVISYIFVPIGNYTVDGYPVNATLSMSFDRSGTVQTLRSDLSGEKMYRLRDARFPQDVLKTFTDQLGEVDKPDSVITVTGCRVVYSQTIGLDEYGYASPILELTYEVNGEGESTEWIFPADE